MESTVELEPLLWESADVEERAVNVESAVRGQRVVLSESTEAPERAGYMREHRVNGAIGDRVVEVNQGGKA